MKQRKNERTRNPSNRNCNATAIQELNKILETTMFSPRYMKPSAEWVNLEDEKGTFYECNYYIIERQNHLKLSKQ